MGVFKDHPNEKKRLDYLILHNNAGVNLYNQKGGLKNDLDWLKQENYKVVEFNCNSWGDRTMHKDFKEKLNFPDHYGENFAALNDCLSDLNIIKTGIVLVFWHMDNLDAKTIHALLDMMAYHSRAHMLFGRRFITLVHVQDLEFKTDPIGAQQLFLNH